MIAKFLAFVNPILTDPLYRKYLSLTCLNIISNLAVPLAGIVDTAVLGRYSGPIYIAGVSLATVLFDYLYWGFGFLRMGTTGTTAIRIGGGDETGAHLVLYRSLGLGFSIGLAILLFSPFIYTYGFNFLAGEDSLKEIGKEYFRFRIWDAPFTLMNMVFVGWFLGRGRSDLVLFLTFLSNGVNILLDFYFLGRLGLGADGVGLASGIAQFVQFFFSCILFRNLHQKLILAESIRKMDLKTKEIWNKILNPKEFKALLSFNKDIFFRTILLITTFSVFRNVSASIGTETLTVNTILFQFFLVYAFFIDGSVFATETIVGHLFGNREFKKMQSILSFGFQFGIFVSFAWILVLEIFPDQLIGLLIEDPSTIDSTKSVLIVFYPVLILGAFAFVYDGFFLGIVRAKTLRNSMVISTLGIFLPLALLAVYFHSNILIWVAMSSYMFARASTLHFAYRSLMKISYSSQ
jgi:MATE family multidrug resistance protein